MDGGATGYYRAYLSRDARFDGRFFVGVVTTGIYCRPICPAPSPRPKNVRFFACAAAAEEGGFRPCRRCRPETSPGTPAWLGTSATVSRALRLISEGGIDERGLEDLADRLGVTSRHLRRLFSKHLGASPIAIAQTRRIHFARVLIDEMTLPMHEIALHAGFRSVRQFNHAILKSFRRSPTELRRRSRGRSGETPDSALRLKLAYRPPFDWNSVAGYLGQRAIPGVEEVTDAAYRRTVELDGSSGVIEVRPFPKQNSLLLRVDVANPIGLLHVVERARRIFDLGADPLWIAEHLARDARLRSWIQARNGLRVPGTWDGFELAVRAVLGQQVSVAAATTLSGRLVRRFGIELPVGPDGKLTHLFPRPAGLARANLEAIGLPSARAQAIRKLASAVSAGRLRLDASAGLERALKGLCEVPGIGSWTAHYIAMRALREPDAFPATDLGLRRALGSGTEPASAAAVDRAAEAWRPWRAYAAMALWMGKGRGQEDEQWTRNTSRRSTARSARSFSPAATTT